MLIVFRRKKNSWRRRERRGGGHKRGGVRGARWHTTATAAECTHQWSAPFRPKVTIIALRISEPCGACLVLHREDISITAPPGREGEWSS